MTMTYAELECLVEQARQEDAERNRSVYQSIAREKLITLQKILGEDFMSALEDYIQLSFYENEAGEFTLQWSGVPVALKISRYQGGSVEAHWWQLGGYGIHFTQTTIDRQRLPLTLAEIAETGVDPAQYHQPSYMGETGVAAARLITSHLATVSGLTGTTMERIQQLMALDAAATDMFDDANSKAAPRIVTLGEIWSWEVIEDDSAPF
jgi:hypothetical protein